MKQAEAPRTNEDETVSGEIAVYEDPAGRDEPMGEQEHGSAAHAGHHETREGMLGRIFGHASAAASDAKKTISENFTTRDYEAHTALLNYKTASAEESETLTEKVRRVCGRR